MPSWWDKLIRKTIERSPSESALDEEPSELPTQSAPPVAEPRRAPARPAPLEPVQVPSAAAPLLSLAFKRGADGIILNPEEGTADVWLVIGASMERVTSTGPELVGPTGAALRSLDGVRGLYEDTPFSATTWSEEIELGTRVLMQLDPVDLSDAERDARRDRTADTVLTNLPPTALSRNQNDEVLRLLKQHPPVPDLLTKCFQAQGLPVDPDVSAVLAERRLPRKSVTAALACSWGVPYLDAEICDIGREAKDVLDEAYCRRHTVLCVHLDPQRGTLLMANPFAFNVLHEVSTITGRKMFPAVSSWQDIRNRLDQVWPKK